MDILQLHIHDLGTRRKIMGPKAVFPVQIKMKGNRPQNIPITTINSFTLAPYLIRPHPDHLTNKAQTPQANIKHKQRIHRQPNPILDHATPTQNTHARSHRPAHQQQVHRDPRNPIQMQGGQQRRNNQRKQRIPNDTNTLRERARSAPTQGS